MEKNSGFQLLSGCGFRSGNHDHPHLSKYAFYRLPCPKPNWSWEPLLSWNPWRSMKTYEDRQSESVAGWLRWHTPRQNPSCKWFVKTGIRRLRAYFVRFVLELARIYTLEPLEVCGERSRREKLLSSLHQGRALIFQVCVLHHWWFLDVSCEAITIISLTVGISGYFLRFLHVFV